MQKIQEHFKVSDPVMVGMMRTHSVKPRKRSTKDRFEYLALTILYQQLSTKVADVIAARFLALFQPLPNPPLSRGGGTAAPRAFPTPQDILKTPDEKLRSVGVSGPKVKYIKDLAEKVASKQVRLEILHELSDEEVITELTQVKGIGRWTAEMFLMSALERPDIFSFGDLGLQTAIKRAYGFKQLPAKRTMERLSKKWSPYRTHAARVLWASLDNE
ncbi:MAG: DNA-3-methyladenine glycosylase 2 family protein [Candidatus Doudnabacteria bacterium]|nr:DNA-3-methyladenine glycosylase 2 family protein [Candidatus Doudnabacteria bacterium]